MGNSIFWVRWYKCNEKIMGKSESVQVVLLNSDGEVLAVSRKNDHNDFGLPGGKIEPYDKSLVSAAIREVKEETGVDIFNIELIFAMHRNGHMGYTFIADYSGEINYDTVEEPHVVKWTNYLEVIKGSFGTWNELVLTSLHSKGLKVKL